MAAPELRPMGIGDILDATFRLYRAHFVTYLLIVLVPFVPYSIVAAVFLTIMTQSVQQLQGGPFQGRVFLSDARSGSAVQLQGGPQNPFQPIQEPDMTGFFTGWIGLMVVAILFSVVVLPLVEGALTLNISAGYLNQELGAWESYSRAAPRMFQLLGAGLLAGLAFYAGCMFCVVPGLIILAWFLVAAPIVVLERRGVFDSLGRSRELMSGNLGKGLLLGFLILLLRFFVGGGLSVAFEFIPWPHEFLKHFSNNILQAVILPIQLAPVILLYYDLRIRKEAFDLNVLANDLGRPQAA